jgi:hypothetical protein
VEPRKCSLPQSTRLLGSTSSQSAVGRNHLKSSRSELSIPDLLSRKGKNKDFFPAFWRFVELQFSAGREFSERSQIQTYTWFYKYNSWAPLPTR